LIIFPRGGKTDWGKKRGILEDLFGLGRKERIDPKDDGLG
jgi:hypothetical protein